MTTDTTRSDKRIVRNNSDCHDPCLIGIDAEGNKHYNSLSRPLIVILSPEKETEQVHYDDLPETYSGLSGWAKRVTEVADGWVDGPHIADSELDDDLRDGVLLTQLTQNR